MQPSPQATEHATQRFAALDGLRAVAALGVLLYHVAGWTGRPGGFAHGYLAVDFFFCLSGFVLAHAFERRQIGWPAYLRIRIIRIWPLLVLSTLIGAILFTQGAPPFWTNLARGLLLIPRMGDPPDWTFPSLFPFNPLAWSLCLEVIVSVLWFPLRRLPDLGLMVIVLLSGAMMVYVAWTLNGIETGWDQATFWWGVARATFSFSLGWACWRYRALAPRPRLLLPVILLAVVMAMPVLPWNGLYDLACVAVVFPVLMLMGAHDPKGAAGAVCRTAGDLSYPLYALHWATWAVMLRLYPAEWKLPLPLWFGVLGLIVAPAVAWVAFRFYDAPVRRWLRRL